MMTIIKWDENDIFERDKELEDKIGVETKIYQ